jgi:tetratricopeptide (TPR) repeat protein
VTLARRLCGTTVIAAGVLLGVSHIADSDVWTHLAHGRALVAARGLPVHEPFTYPSATMPYYNTEWLFGVVLYLAHAVGGPTAVIAFKATLLGLLAWLLWSAAMLAPPGEDDHPQLRTAVAAAVVLAALLAMRYRFVERPDVGLMVFIAVTIYALDLYVIRGRPRALYWLIPVAVIWANVHPSVIVAAGPFGAVLAGGLALRALARLGGAEIPARPTIAQLRVVAAVAVGVLVASLVNPYGWDAVTLPFRLTGSEWFTQEIGELQRPRAADHPITVALGVAFAAILLANLRRAPVIAAMTAAPFAWLALSGTRFVFLLPLVVTPPLARGVTSLLATVPTARLRRAITLGASGVALGMAVATGLAVANAGPLGDRARMPGFGVNRLAIPEGALAYLDRVGVRGPIFNAFHFGGYVAWRDFPHRAPIVDGRAWVPPGLIDEIHFARVYPAHLARLQATYGFEAAVMDYATFAGEPLHEVAPGADGGLTSPAWALVYWDDVALVYLRREGPFATIATRDEYRHLRPANGPAALMRALEAGVPPAAVAAEIARNEHETGSAVARTLAGAVALHARDWDGALARFASVHDGPWRLYALQGEAVAAGAKGQFARSLDAYARLLAETDDATMSYYAGLVALSAHRDAEAIHHLERARRRDPGLAAVYPPLIDAYRRRGDTAAVRDAVAAHARAEAVWRAREQSARGRALLRDGHPAEAAQEFEAALARDGSDPRARSGLGYAYAALGRLDEAEAAQRAALRVDPMLATAHYGLALLDERRGDRAAARRHFEAFLRLEPRSYAAWQLRQRLASRPR